MIEEEKAKAYDEALSKCKAYIDDTEKRWSEEFSRATEEVFKEIFPELAESEDERIRTWLLECVENLSDGNFIEVSKQDVLLYLEKQKEQKPVEIHIDNPNIQKVDPDVKVTTSDSSAGGDELLYVSDKSYKIGFRDGVASVKPAEWSEEDKRKLNRIYEVLGYAADDKGFLTSKRIIGDKEAIELQDFLKSLHPSWKPSEEQMKVDLGAEIEMEWDSFSKHIAEYGEESDEVVWLNRFSFVDIANYFYELGKNSK